MPPPNSKRKRASESSAGSNKHALFTQWAQDRGVEINGVRAERLPGRGLGVVTTRRVKAGEKLIFIPEKAMFKPSKELLAKTNLMQASPQAQLAVTAMQEFKNDFLLWKDVLPTYDDFEASMPMLWAEEMRKLLPPPVHQPLERQMKDYQRDWEDIVRGGGVDDDEKSFKYWWLIVNSRSFHWKPPRGKAGVMVMCPFIDYMNHGPTGSTANVTMTEKGYKVAAERDYAPGEEILATYGPHSNDKLLIHYGFINSSSSPNPDDDIRLDHIILPNLPQNIKDQLQDVGFLGAYALLPATNELCFKTQVAVRAGLLTANEWEYFLQNGEDLGEDVSGVVEGRVAGWLGEYARMGDEVGVVLGGMGESVARELLEERWRQILEALAEFGRMVDGAGAGAENQNQSLNA